jgi:hypothetical protein
MVVSRPWVRYFQTQLPIRWPYHGCKIYIQGSVATIFRRWKRRTVTTYNIPRYISHIELRHKPILHMYYWLAEQQVFLVFCLWYSFDFWTRPWFSYYGLVKKGGKTNWVQIISLTFLPIHKRKPILHMYYWLAEQQVFLVFCLWYSFDLKIYTLVCWEVESGST